jgi:hypothetical protein
MGMDSPTPPNTRPIPFPESRSCTLTENVRERALLAVSFAEDFERLLEMYNISEYDIYVRSPVFTLHYSKVGIQGEKQDSELVSDPDATPIKSFFFNLK